MTSMRVLERAGFSREELSGGALAVRSPIDGAEIARVRETPAVGHARGHRPGAKSAFLAWREVPAPRRGELVRLLGEELRAAKEALGRARHAGGWQDRLRGPGRSAGDDRHLRFRRRPVAADLRPDHRLGASRPPHDGDLASARALRGHLRLQFPGRGLGVERGAGARLRRSGDLEALGKDAA